VAALCQGPFPALRARGLPRVFAGRHAGLADPRPIPRPPPSAAWVGDSIGPHELGSWGLRRSKRPGRGRSPGPGGAAGRPWPNAG